MVKFHDDLRVKYEYNDEGKNAYSLFNLADFEGMSKRVRLFSYVEIDCGEEVAYHVHEGETENYYIISGKGLYNDNGKVCEIGPGATTFTPSGHGHSLKNIEKGKIWFVAMIIKKK